MFPPIKREKKNPNKPTAIAHTVKAVFLSPSEFLFKINADNITIVVIKIGLVPIVAPKYCGKKFIIEPRLMVKLSSKYTAIWLSYNIPQMLISPPIKNVLQIKNADLYFLQTSFMVVADFSIIISFIEITIYKNDMKITPVTAYVSFSAAKKANIEAKTVVLLEKFVFVMTNFDIMNKNPKYIISPPT